ncbi:MULTISPECIES: transporter [unclassified Imperialibacter]|uniref:transporter n=1 Tax=unclassified Imperialibacter TaxID=2629706 RepID=UPI001255645E|nr:MULTISPECIES: transporter [unclassified Imperialibacter]CAD5253764.1 conserved exported hypothetical protein [Imperialibacter sp. 75]CAD5262120.1 conserved exported hypothetical protein [Imperialibacter sp. 89]VVT35189.1 conserved exported hypothetical protein [Imperialibacter sp. EC-SDR9]
MAIRTLPKPNYQLMVGLLMLVLSCLSIPKAAAQYNPTIRSARPGQSVGPFTTGKNVFQVQTGGTYNAYSVGNTDVTGTNYTYLASLRYGILERLEIRSAFALRHDKTSVSDLTAGGLGMWNAGIRYNLLDGHGEKPSLGIQADARFTAVDEDYKAANLAPRIMLIHGQRLTDKLGLTTNWAVAWTGNNTDPAFNYTVNLSFPLAEKVGSFIENYGTVFNGDFDNRWNTGLSYLVNNDFLLDMSVGYGKNDGVSDWFVDAGVSWRIKLGGRQ